MNRQVFKVGDKVRGVKYAPKRVQTVIEIKDTSQMEGTSGQWIKTNRKKDDWVDAAWFTPFKTSYIRDDLREVWTFDGERVYCLAAEEEAIREGLGHPGENGYPCTSWAEAVEILNEEGYITHEPLLNFTPVDEEVDA